MLSPTEKFNTKESFARDGGAPTTPVEGEGVAEWKYLAEGEGEGVTAAGTTALDGAEATEVPRMLVAVTVNV